MAASRKRRRDCGEACVSGLGEVAAKLPRKEIESRLVAEDKGIAILVADTIRVSAISVENSRLGFAIGGSAKKVRVRSMGVADENAGDGGSTMVDSGGLKVDGDGFKMVDG